MSKQTKEYTEAFKSEAVALAKSRGSINQAALSLGIAKSTLYKWSQKAGGLDSSTPSGPSTEQLLQENKALKKRLAKLEEEQAILKKAATYFAKELS